MPLREIKYYRLTSWDFFSLKIIAQLSAFNVLCIQIQITLKRIEYM